MRFNPGLICITLILCVTFYKAHAQATEVEITPSHLQAAEQFLIATGINKQFEAIADNLISTASSQFPANNRAAFVAVMTKFMKKYYTWENVKGQMSKIYATEFEEKELIDLAAFYNSPVGRKYSEKLPLLMHKGMAMGQQVMTNHKAEFLQMMKEGTK